MQGRIFASKPRQPDPCLPPSPAALSHSHIVAALTIFRPPPRQQSRPLGLRDIAWAGSLGTGRRASATSRHPSFPASTVRPAPPTHPSRPACALDCPSIFITSCSILQTTRYLASLFGPSAPFVPYSIFHTFFIDTPYRSDHIIPICFITPQTIHSHTTSASCSARLHTRYDTLRPRLTFLRASGAKGPPLLRATSQ